MHGPPPTRQLVLILGLLPLALLGTSVLPDYFLYICNMLMMYAILAIGLDILLGWSGQFAFAHIAFYGIGAYGTALLNIRLGIPFLVGMPLAALLAALIGWLIAIPSTRLRAVYLALATFAFAECAQWVFRTWDSLTKGPDGLRIPAPEVFGFVLGTDRSAMPVVAAILCLMLLGSVYLSRSRLGRDFFAIRDSEHVAAACGVDVKRTKIVAFVISAFYAGVAGGTYTLFQSFVHPDTMGVWTLVLVLTMVVVGGSGSIAGALLGALLLGLLPEVLRAAPKGILVWQEFAYGAILLLSIMFMPTGIWGLFARFRRAERGKGAVSAPGSGWTDAVDRRDRG